MTQRRDGYRIAGHERSLPPRDQPPNGQPPGVNPPPTTVNPPGTYNPISVGPDASDGYGNTHVLGPNGSFGPPPVSAWSGWPDGWSTPPWRVAGEAPSGLMGAWGRLADVVYAAVDLNASILSTMPPYIVKGAEPQPSQPWLENPEPLVYTSWTEFAKELFWSFEATGEAFIAATARYADTGYPMRFMVVNPAFVKVDLVAGRRVYSIAGDEQPEGDVLHIRYASWPGDLRGHGPLEAAGARLLAVDALARYSTSLADNGGLPPAVIRYPKRVSRAQMRQMQADYVEARRSALAVPAILADGAELDAQTSGVRDMALTDLQRFNEARLSVLLGVPPTLLALPSGDPSTYTNSTNIFDFHWRAGLRPKAASVMAALSGWLLPRGSGIELNRDEYIRPGMFERAQAYSMLIGSGVLLPEEVRVLERYSGDPKVPAAAISGAQPSTPPEANVVPFGTPGRPVQTNTGGAGA
jgi:HK97 family phage portal protein